MKSLSSVANVIRLSLKLITSSYMRSLTKDKIYKCHQFDKTFPWNTNLKNHLKGRTGEIAIGIYSL